MPIRTKPIKAFTARSQGIAKVINTPLDAFVPGTKNGVRVSGIWDTGATGTAITTHLVTQLGLIPVGKTLVNTAGGQVEQHTYVVDIGLPNNVTVAGIVATEIPSLPSDNEVLIGMDIITLGDFSVTHFKGKSCVSFRLPSIHEIDYANNPNLKVSTTPPTSQHVKIGRNDRCPCGSGKKYKRCHGGPQKKAPNS